MAEKKDQKITGMDTPWNGYIGKRVEEFIKENLTILDKSIKTGDIKVCNSKKDEGDLGIADSDGNVIIRLQNGHIQTQKFNSENPFEVVVKEESRKEKAVFGNFVARIITTQNRKRVAIITNGFVEDRILYL